MEARHHSSIWNSYDLGDLFVGVALNIGVVDNHPEIFRNRGERFFYIAIGKVFEHFIFGGFSLIARVRCRFVDLPIFDFTVRDLWSALIFSIGVNKSCCQNAIEPGFEIGAWFKLMKRVKCLCKGILNKIFRILLILCISESCSVESIGKDQRISLKPLFTSTRSLSHPVDCQTISGRCALLQLKLGAHR